MNLFGKKSLLVITIIILIGVGISVVMQLYNSDSKTKKINSVLSKSILVKYETPINAKIYDITYQHEFVIYITNNYEKGYYFGIDDNHKKSDNSILDFIKKNETILVKNSNDSVAFFINKKDTIKMVFSVDKSTSALINGRR